MNLQISIRKRRKNMGNETVTVFGKTNDGTETHLYELVNKNGMKAYVTDFGATLVLSLIHI